MDAINNPRKFYALLTLSGMQANDAYRIVYNLKHPRLTSSSFKTKMQMLHLLQNIIELITKDRILYSRLRSLAQSGETQHIGKNIASYSKRSKSFKDVVEMGVGTASIAGVAKDGETDRDVPAPLASDRKAILSKLKSFVTKFRRRKPNTDPTRFITVHGG